MTPLHRLRSLARERPALALLAGVTALWFPFVFLLNVWLVHTGQAANNPLVAPLSFWDWGAYGSAVNRWQAGEAIYIRNDSGGFHGKYLYPPFVLLLILPFTFFEYPQGPAVWGLVSTVLLWLGLVAVVRHAGHDSTRLQKLLLLVAVLGFQPLLLSVKMGQMAGFMVGTLCLAYAALPRGATSTGRSFLSGLLTGAVGLAKLPYAPASAHLLTDRNRLVGGAVAAVGLVGLSLAVFGVETNVGYLDVWRWGIEAGGRARSPVHMKVPYYRPFYPIAAHSFPVQIGLSAVVAALALKAPEEYNHEVFALGLASIPLISPKTYTYYLVAMLPAAAVLLVREHGRDGFVGVPIAAILLANLQSYGLRVLVDVAPKLGGFQSTWEAALPFLQPGLWGNVLLVGFAALRLSEQVSWTGLLARSQSASDRG